MLNDPGRILAIDPGEKRLGIAVSDPTQIIASPLCVIDHQSRLNDAEAILTIAEEQNAVLIIVGQPLGWNDDSGPQAQKSVRLADEIRKLSSVPVQLWNEYGSTQAAQAARRKMNVSRKKRTGHLDDLAAAIILQSFLDTRIDAEDV